MGSLSLVCMLVLAAGWAAGSSECPYGKCLFVTNRCPMQVYLERTNIDSSNGVVNSVTPLVSGNTTILDVTAWEDKVGQRLYAWWINPVVGYALDSTRFADKVEINVCYSNTQFCYNPTAVDYLALPVSIGPQVPADCPSVPYTGTLDRKVASVKSGCPTLWVEGAPWGTCKSAGAACSIQPSLDICSALDPVVSQCISDKVCKKGSTTEQAYLCSEWFAGQPGYCAAINRGVYPSLDQQDPSQFYLDSPFNEYSAWIHEGLEREYAFPYDDYQGDGASGYEQCATDSLQVIWCPAD